jgi:hypothetical protein
MQSIGDILDKKSVTSDHRNKYEFQAYGNRLAEEFSDTKHRSLYIKLAKEEDRNLLEAARIYVMGAEKITQKGRLFMWKLSELKKEKTENKDKVEDGG